MLAWLSGLSILGKVSLGVASLFAVGTAAAIATPTPTPEPVQQVQSSTNDQEVKSVVENKNEQEIVVIPYKTTNQDTSKLDKGTTQVSQAGVDGEKIITYKVTYTDGVETSRTAIKEDISINPVNKIVLVGTYVYIAPAPIPQAETSNCDPNYSGGCVPIASDVDCAGGSGNGPAYVSGPVYVVGSDIYGLDGDNDGVGCE